MRHLFLALGTLFVLGALQAQQGVELEGRRCKETMEAIAVYTRQVTSIQCSFVQTKRSKMLNNATTATGTMEYTAPDKLVWAYATPFKYVLNIDGNNVAVTGKGADNKGANYQAKAMSRLILGCVNGNQLFDERMFSYRIYDDGKKYAVALVPKRKEMLRVFQEIVICFDKKSLVAESIVLKEGSGDSTSIRFENVKVKL
ncbi:MAG: outer membrane lipoprotein carrier protein LolA [Bacteroidales bacterium]|nr:outer membrane lipoprotein carrier protein LolA [Bacteroidales bacterium]